MDFSNRKPIFILKDTTIGGPTLNDVTKKRDDLKKNPIHHKRISLRHISLISDAKESSKWEREWDGNIIKSPRQFVLIENISNYNIS